MNTKLLEKKMHMTECRYSEYTHKDWIMTTTFTINGSERRVLLEHPAISVENPTTTIAFKNIFIRQGDVLVFGIGIRPDAWAMKGDGVEFEVLIKEHAKDLTLFKKYIDPKSCPSDRKWFDEEIEISDFAGKQVDFLFKTSPGLQGDPSYDWAGWSGPRIIDGTIVRYDFIDMLEHAFVLEYQTKGDIVEKYDHELIPLEEIHHVGDGDFKIIGQLFLGYFIELCGLKPNESVLDVGCGIGRIAAPLTQYLNKDTGYEGFDIVNKGIEWCREKISTKYPNFHFQLADIFNKCYNPNGRYKADEYKFPYENESFSFVFLTSVFTHMLPNDMENYISEIVRVLKREGRCFITFFLLNKESLELNNTGKSEINLKHNFGKHYSINTDTLEAAIGYAEEFILDLFKKYGLKIKLPIHYGKWCGRSNVLYYQDIIIASKV